MRTERIFRNYLVKALFFMLMLITCLSVHLVAYADTLPVGSIAYANVDTKLNIRREPQGLIIGGIPKGTTVTILSEIDRNGYYRIRVHSTGQECYAYGEYLEPLYTEPTIGNVFESETPPKNESQLENYNEFLTISQFRNPQLEDATLVVISERKLNLRKRSNRKGARIMYLGYGDRLQVVNPEIKNSYVLVKDISSGKVGYVDTDYVVFESAYNAHLDSLNTTIETDSLANCCTTIGCWCQCK